MSPAPALSFALLAVLVLAALAVAPAPLGAARPDEPTTWRVARAHGVEVLAAVDERRATEALARVVRFRAALPRAFPGLAAEPTGELQLILLDDSRQFYEFLPTVLQQQTILTHAISPSPIVTTIVVNLDEESRDHPGLETMVGSHAFLEQRGSTAGWITAGFGGLVSGHAVEGDRLVLGKLVGKELARVRRAGPVAPPRLFLPPPTYRQRGDIGPAEQLRGSLQVLFHAGLLGADARFRAGFGALLADPLLSEGGDATVLSRAHLGLDGVELARHLKAHLDAKSHATVAVPLADLPAFRAPAWTELRQGDIRAFRAQAALRVAPGDASFHLSFVRPADGDWRAAVATVELSVERDLPIDPAWIAVLDRFDDDPAAPAYVSLATALALIESAGGPLDETTFRKVLDRLAEYRRRAGDSLAHRVLLVQACLRSATPPPPEALALLDELLARHPGDAVFGERVAFVRERLGGDAPR